MKSISRVLLSLLVCAAIAGTFSKCKNEDKPDIVKRDPSAILISGSESEMKLIHFFTEEFLKKNPGIQIEITGGGSGIGIDDLINGKTDIANSSRLMTAAELSIAKKNGVNPTQLIVAMDAVSIITNPKVGIDSLSMDQISGLLSGTIRNWKEVGGDDIPVLVIGRNENSGTYHYLLNHLHIDSYAAGTQQKAGNDEIVDAVSRKAGAIGYVNLGSIYDENNKPCRNVWVTSIYFDGARAYSPYETEYVSNGEYPLTRPLYQYINGTANETIGKLARFEISDSTQLALRERGYFPIKQIYKTINTKNGF